MKKIVIHLSLFILLIVFACDAEDPQSPGVDCNAGTYVEGCEIESSNQLMEFEYCYPYNCAMAVVNWGCDFSWGDSTIEELCPESCNNCPNEEECVDDDTALAPFSGEKFSLSDHVGKVFMIEMSASW